MRFCLSRRHSRRGDGANLTSSSSDGIFLASDHANASSQCRQIGTTQSFVLPDLTGNHVRDLDDSALLPVIGTRADIAEAPTSSSASTLSIILGIPIAV